MAHHDLGGRVSQVGGTGGRAILASILNWQNDQGQRVRQELTLATVGVDRKVVLNPPELADWLLEPQAELTPEATPQGLSEDLWELAERAIETRLAVRSNQDLHPESIRPVAAGWAV